MTKLRFRIKQQAKKRSHRRTVAKRRDKRTAETAIKSAEEKKEREEKSEFNELLREATLRANPSSTTTSGGGGGGGAAAAAGKKKSNKNTSRKQLKRKEKSREKGEAVADRRVVKTVDKVSRVKFRAQVRNSELHNN